MVDVMNMVGITHVCLGNHEFDVPLKSLKERIQESSFLWINSNMRTLDDELDVTTLPYDIIPVVGGASHHQATTKHVALLGLLTNDPSLYRPGLFGQATLEPVIETAQALQQQLRTGDVDLILPLTHQSIPEDAQFAKFFGGAVFPVILGGHDHCEYDETFEGTRVLKSGLDGRSTNIIDVVWPQNDEDASTNPSPMTIEVVNLPTDSFPPNAELQSRIQDHLKIVEELEQAKLFKVGHWAHGEVFSTKDNRLGPSRGSTSLITMIRMGMQATCCILNAGAIRGNKTYDSESYFTMSDLKAEIAFSTGMITLWVPGNVLEETIRNSRRYSSENPPVANGCFLHTCNNMDYDHETQKLERIQGKPMEPDALYLTAMNVQFLEGIDQHTPLLEWVKNDHIVWNVERAVPAKLVLVELFSAVLWLHLGNFDELDINCDGQLCREEVRASVAKHFGGTKVTDLVVDNVFSIADLDSTGFISPMEVVLVHLTASDLLEQSFITHEDERLDKAMKETVARVLNEKDLESDAVRMMVERVKTQVNVGPDGVLRRVSHNRTLGELQRRSLLL